jgi:signal transduction histidine kinase
MKENQTSSRYGWWAIALAVITAVAGISISLTMRTRIAQSEADTARLAAESLLLNTQQEMDLFVEVLESVRALHALSGAIDQAAMDEFIEKGLVHQQTVLGAFGLAQRVSPPMRAQIESKKKPAPGAYDIVEKGLNGNWAPAAVRTEYYPLTWQIHPNALNIPVGYDFFSEEEARRIILSIERTRRTVLVPEPVSLPQTEPDGYWVFSPVMPRIAPESVIGLAVAILRPNEILRKVSGASVSNPDLQLTPVDRRPPVTIKLKDSAWHYSGPMEAIGTIWKFDYTLPVNQTNRRSTAIFAAGLVITALMTTLLLILAGRTRRIESEVLTRTEELRVANMQLEENLHERMRMEEEMNELSAREQRRIGRDLHDSFGQKLTGAVFLSRSLLNWFKEQSAWGMEHEEKSPDTRHSTLDTQLSHARTLNDTLKSAVSQVRSMARGLASVTLNDESLEESFDQLADEMSSLYEVSCSAEIEGNPASLNRKVKEQLYFIAREAANNAARHAKAKHITIQLTGHDSEWVLRIEDDGTGFSENPDNEGMGLRTMRYRAGRIGAKFAITSASGKGTMIEINSNP